MKIKCPITSDNLMKIINIQFECKGKNDQNCKKKRKTLLHVSKRNLQCQLDCTITITALQLLQISCLLFDAESGTSLVQ